MRIRGGSSSNGSDLDGPQPVRLSQRRRRRYPVRRPAAGAAHAPPGTSRRAARGRTPRSASGRVSLSHDQDPSRAAGAPRLCASLWARRCWRSAAGPTPRRDRHHRHRLDRPSRARRAMPGVLPSQPAAQRLRRRSRFQKQYLGRAAHASPRPSSSRRWPVSSRSKMARTSSARLFAPLFQEGAQVAIASVASSKRLLGGRRQAHRDHRRARHHRRSRCADLLGGVGDPVPPVSTPPPSSVGYVDQTQAVDATAQGQSRDRAEFVKFKTAQDKTTGKTSSRPPRPTPTATRSTRTTARRSTTSRTRSLDQPMVDQTRSASESRTSRRRRTLVLVIDKGDNLIYGGTDITTGT